MKLTKEQNEFYNKYILSCISNEGYNNKELNTEEEKLKFLFETFKAEGLHDNNKNNIQLAFKNWVQGLPSTFNIEFENYKIIELAIKGGSLKADSSEKETDKILNNYFDFITAKTFKLFKKYKII